ncbi:hypothetical protein KKG77_00710 [bacterium]|nr:hypothetical protein [bacterium]
MKKIISTIAIIGCFSGVFGESNFNVGFSGSDEGIDSFSLSIGNYYGVPVQEVREVEYYVPREHASIVYFLANNAHVNAHYVTDLRREGLSWWNISLRLGLDPYMLYRVDNRYYGKSRHHRLRDAEIADYVNVRFISDYHHINRNEVIDRRRQGERYYHINDSYHKKQDRPQYREERKIHNERKVETIQRERQENRKEIREDRRDVKGNQRDNRDKNSKSDNKRKNNDDKRNGNSHDR